jgi:hypothetical protein
MSTDLRPSGGWYSSTPGELNQFHLPARERTVSLANLTSPYLRPPRPGERTRRRIGDLGKLTYEDALRLKAEAEQTKILDLTPFNLEYNPKNLVDPIPQILSLLAGIQGLRELYIGKICRTGENSVYVNKITAENVSSFLIHLSKKSGGTLKILALNNGCLEKRKIRAVPIQSYVLGRFTKIEALSTWFTTRLLGNFHPSLFSTLENLKVIKIFGPKVKGGSCTKNFESLIGISSLKEVAIYHSKRGIPLNRISLEVETLKLCGCLKEGSKYSKASILRQLKKRPGGSHLEPELIVVDNDEMPS